MRQLLKIEIDGTWYYIDKRLRQFRNVDDPYDFEDASEELIEFWLDEAERRNKGNDCGKQA